MFDVIFMGKISYLFSTLIFFFLKMADIGLTENYGDSGYKFEIWFRRRSLGGNYILQAPNSEVKRTWVREISKLLWHQAIKNRGRISLFMHIVIPSFHAPYEIKCSKEGSSI